MKVSSLNPIAVPLINWFRKNQRPFPWRLDPNPYSVWLSEVMSQQTQMATVLPYHARFLEKFPNVEALAKAKEDQILALWTGLGYYSRARNLLKAAKVIMNDYQGQFPDTYEGWLELPGIGPYTAAAISSISQNQAVPLFDGNVLRVTARLLGIKKAHTNGYKTEVLKILKNTIQSVDPSAFNQGLMELGSQICKPISPMCHRCPLNTKCKAYSLNLPENYPDKKIRKKNKLLQVKSLIIKNKKNKYLLIKREKNTWFQGLIDFPSELGGIETPKRKLAIPKKSKRLGKVKHNITHHKIELTAYLTLYDQKPFSNAVAGKWLSIDDLVQDKLPLATTAKKILRLLLRKC